MNPSSPAIKHFCDIIYHVDPNTVNIDNLKAIIRDKAWNDLPDVMKLSERPVFEYISQYFLLPQTDGKVCLIKHFYIKDDKVKGQYVQRLVKGSGYEVAWTGLNKQKARRGLQYMLEQLDGQQFRHFSLSAEKKKTIAGPLAASEEDQDAGWDFIIVHGERDKGNLKQLRWIHRHIHRDGSPINGWNEKLVQRALDSLANDGTMAAVVSRYDLTLDTLEPPILEIMEQIVPYLRGHALWLLGEPGVGKTPLGRMLAMAFSRYHGGTGTFRSASDFDFFRGVFFDKTCPALYDDGEIGGELIKKKKAFSDVSDQETILKERWTAAKFVQHQLRIVLDNQYDPADEPEEVPLQKGITHSAFMKLVRPALGYISGADSRAILKRAAFMVFSKNWVYYRPPTEKEVEVLRLKWPRGDLLQDSCKHIIANFKAGGPAPEDYEEKVAWEMEWLEESCRKHDHPDRLVQPAQSATPMLDALMSADAHPPAAPVRLASSDGLRPPSAAPLALLPGIPKLEPQEHKDGHAWLATETAHDPVNVDTDRASDGWSGFAPVKQEPAVSFKSLAVKRAGVIELDTPSPRPRKAICLEGPPNPDNLPGLQLESDDDALPAIGELPDDDGDDVIGGAGSQHAFKDVCLVLALQSLGLPVSCDTDGPFPISYGNTLLLPFGLQLCQKLCRKSLPDGGYIVFDKAAGHFFALQTREGFTVKKDEGKMFILSAGAVVHMLQSDNYILYFIQKQSYAGKLCFDALGGSSPETYTCPLDKCVCEGCSGSLIHHLYVEAVLYDLNGPIPIVHEQKNCTSRSCRASYGYNYRWEEGQKVNVLGMSDFQDNILFVNSKKAFTLKYLQYHEELLFRGHLSSMAVSCAYHAVHGDSSEAILYNFHKLHASALFYYMAVREFEVLGLHKDIVIDQELKDEHLDLYDAFCHSDLFPPTNRKQMKTLVLDGNQKLKMHCEVAPMKRAGRPRKSEHTVGQYTNGWMLGCDPKSGRIITLQVMHEPENNEVASLAVENIIWLYPKLDCIVYDRACAFKQCGESNDMFQQITSYVVDGFHAHGHSRTCPCNPRLLFYFMFETCYILVFECVSIVAVNLWICLLCRLKE